MGDSRSTVIVLIICALLWVGIVLSNAKTVLDSEIYEPAVPEAEVQEFARAQLAQLQQRSFDEDIELCGVIAERSTGELVTRSVIVGHEASCDITYFDVRSLLPRATFHTHASHNEEYDSEVPSTIDLEGDIASRMNGYISTPGGRFWHLDWQEGVARQVCGEGCLPKDPAYRACDTEPPKAEYTLTTLRERDSSLLAAC